MTTKERIAKVEGILVHLATKADIERLETRMESMATKEDIANLNTRIESGFEKLKGQIDVGVAKAENKNLRWFMAAVMAVAALLSPPGTELLTKLFQLQHSPRPSLSQTEPSKNQEQKSTKTECYFAI